MELGREAAAFVTQGFVKPINLLFEKVCHLLYSILLTDTQVYYPYLLINKKRYAGMYWSKPDKYDHMDTKGIEVWPTVCWYVNMYKTVRRDNCLLVRKVIGTCLQKILMDRDIPGAVAYPTANRAHLIVQITFLNMQICEGCDCRLAE